MAVLGREGVTAAVLIALTALTKIASLVKFHGGVYAEVSSSMTHVCLPGKT